MSAYACSTRCHRLHAARRSSDYTFRTGRVEPQPEQGVLAADDRAVGAQRRTDLWPHTGANGALAEGQAVTVGESSVNVDLTATGSGSAQLYP